MVAEKTNTVAITTAKEAAITAINGADNFARETGDD
jgi:hypothetical protein